MKVVFCTSLFTFLVLFNSIKLSSQGNSGGVHRVDEYNSFIRELPDIPAGHYYILPNGNVYQSRGTGPIVVTFSKNLKTATVYQDGVNPAIIGPGPFGKRHYSEEYPVVQMTPVPQRVPPRSPPRN